ncbi:transposase [Candidatus Woesearchaeota archaeon]|nr:transposase [Candidatus Woesearchaeota archaeon]
MGMIKLLCSFARIPVDIPSWRSLCRYRTNQFIKPYLDSLIYETSKPLELLENDFSTDASGTSTKTFSSWYSITAKKKVRRRDHIMSHVTTSRILNSAVAVDVDCDRGKDSIYMRGHVDRVKKNFRINDWCGDGMYCSRDNCDKVRETGGNPWFRPKKSFTLKQRGSKAYTEMMIAFIIETEESLKRYHKRSNSESTFSAKKRKFGNSVRSRNDVAKENEEHLAWICYNLSVLSRAKYEHGIVLS